MRQTWKIILVEAHKQTYFVKSSASKSDDAGQAVYNHRIDTTYK